jgi:hypothetical protein
LAIGGCKISFGMLLVMHKRKRPVLCGQAFYIFIKFRSKHIPAGKDPIPILIFLSNFGIKIPDNDLL